MYCTALVSLTRNCFGKALAESVANASTDPSPLLANGVLACLVCFGTMGHNPVFAQAPGGRGVEKKIATPLVIPRKSGGKKASRQTSPSSPRVNLIGLLIVSKPPNSTVFVNNEPRGETDAGGEIELKLPPGNYSIRVSRDGYITREADVDVLATPEAQQVEFTFGDAGRSGKGTSEHLLAHKSRSAGFDEGRRAGLCTDSVDAVRVRQPAKTIAIAISGLAILNTAYGK